MNKLKLVKILVFILTFLLIFGSLIALTAVFKHSRPIAMAENIYLNEPAGSSIADFKEKNKNLYILIKDGGTDDRIIIIDKKSSKIVSKINLGANHAGN